MSGIGSSQRDDALAGVRDVIERRINAFGVSEPLVQTERDGSHYRIIVELAGIKDVNQAIKMIGETPTLDFRTQLARRPGLDHADRADADPAIRSHTTPPPRKKRT